MTIAVQRALSLLELFTESAPEIGLSDAARLSGHDKATVHRLLGTLRAAELVEQDPQTKLYRIGPAVLRLARVREKSMPLLSVVQPLLGQLTQETGETSHFSLYTGESLVVVASCDSSKPNHVAMSRLEALPLHATASGIAYLAFAAADLVERLVANPLTRYTGRTVTDPDGIRDTLQKVRQAGFAIVDRCYDDDVLGIAVPVFGAPDATAIGALAVAAPRSRMTKPAQARIVELLAKTNCELSRRMGLLGSVTPG
ncbi:IclR family transcriptional regulator [Tabrizicola sp.]|uniref:IclR family transcriptional regulator n=1 Tax=Tabrizicola sp. TaxID=2005166 RepID=UPI001A60159D|nr:IclR family transcriptional regulator [Tabrizicola sp.]MBL9073994.1 IclR family transcriptional regulator [Tabrizicola sp.]